MTLEEIIDLLTFASAVDGRDVGQADVTAWHMIIGDLPFPDAQQALVEHYRESRYKIMPADIRKRVSAIRRTRLEHTPVPAPPAELADRPAEYQAELQRRVRAIASGWDPARMLDYGEPLRAIEGGKP